MKKKGIQLTINFIVIMILALVVFGFSMQYLYSIFAETSEWIDMSNEQLDKKISFIQCGSTQVCLSTTRVTLERDKFKVLGLRILNINSDRTRFSISMTPDNSEGLLDPTDRINLLGHNREDIYVDPAEEEHVGIGIEVAKNAPSGQYAFDIKVQYDFNGVMQSYGEKNYKVFVKVP